MIDEKYRSGPNIDNYRKGLIFVQTIRILNKFNNLTDNSFANKAVSKVSYYKTVDFISVI